MSINQYEIWIADLNSNKSAIITTMCKNYSHRLEEWIQYNLNLGFSNLIISWVTATLSGLYPR